MTEKIGSRITKTVAANTLELEGLFPAEPRRDPAATLNAHYGVASGILPVGTPKIQYFGLGIDGRTAENNAGGFVKLVPRGVKMTNMNLYTQIPLRVVPLEEDLLPGVRANYRMRRIVTIANVPYALYYLKRLTFTTPSVLYTQTDASGNEIEYTVSYEDLNPTPPVSSTNGNQSLSTRDVNISYRAQIDFVGAEILEAVNVLYGGDASYAHISELGFYSGEDKQVTGVAANNGSITYTESVYTQLCVHKTFGGDDYSEPTKVGSYSLTFSNAQVVVIDETN